MRKYNCLIPELESWIGRPKVGRQALQKIGFNLTEKKYSLSLTLINIYS